VCDVLFFFQAEDGIRDLYVTGVQTCALPIWQESSFISEQFKNLKVHLTEASSTNASRVFTVSSPDAQDGKSLVSTALAFSFAMRSEERRVGKECRCWVEREGSRKRMREH